MGMVVVVLAHYWFYILYVISLKSNRPEDLIVGWSRSEVTKSSWFYTCNSHPLCPYCIIQCSGCVIFALSRLMP